MRTVTRCAFAAFQAILVSTVMSQPLAPTQGIQFSDSDLFDIRFPLSVSQCDPVLIYHNTTGPSFIGIDTTIPAEPLRLCRLVTLNIPTGIGYLVWICDIPAGYTFTAEYSFRRFYVVQPGSSSSCLQNVTTTYADAEYLTSDFATYTANAPHTTSPSIPTEQLATYVYTLTVSTLPILIIRKFNGFFSYRAVHDDHCEVSVGV